MAIFDENVILFQTYFLCDTEQQRIFPLIEIPHKNRLTVFVRYFNKGGQRKYKKIVTNLICLSIAIVKGSAKLISYRKK